MELKELREKREAAFQKAETLLNADDFDQTAFDAAVAEVESLDARIKGKAALAEKEALADAIDNGAKRHADEINISTDQARHDGERWLNAYGAWLRAQAPDSNNPLTDEQREVLNIDTKTDAAGGVAVVADGVAGEMFYDVIRYKAPVLEIFDVQRRGRGSKAHAPGIDDSAQYGRLLGEGSQRQRSNLGWVKAPFDFDKFDADWLPVTYEALQDMEIADLGREIMRKASARIARMIGYVTTRATAGSPITAVGVGGANRGTPTATNGIVNAASAGVTTAASNVVTADEFIDFVASLDPAYETGSERLMSSKGFITTIEKMKDGEDRYLFPHDRTPTMLDAMRRRDEVPVRGTINNVPYVLNNEVAPLAAGNVVAVYGDLRAYTVILARAITTERFHDSHTAENGEVWFAAWARGAGLLADSSAVKKLTVKA